MNNSKTNVSKKNNIIKFPNLGNNDIDVSTEKNNRLTNKLFFEFTSQEAINMIEALSVYKNLMLPDRYKPLIDVQLDKITEQLKLQEIDIFANEDTAQYTIGSKVIIDDISGNIEGIIIGASATENFFKVVISKDNKLEVIEVPTNLIK